MRPRIGITSSYGQYDTGSLKGKPRQWVASAYAEAIAAAGGTPLLLPIITQPELAAIVLGDLIRKLDGICITGGSGVLTSGVFPEDGATALCASR